MSLSVSVQYKLKMERIPSIYERFQFSYENFFRNEILSRIKAEALKYSPEAYLSDRKRISERMSIVTKEFLDSTGAILVYYI